MKRNEQEREARPALLVLVLCAVLVLWQTPSPAGAAGRCKRVSATKASVVLSRLQPGLTVRHLHAVRSSDYADVTFVAGDLQGPGLNGPNDIAVWAVGGSVRAPSSVQPTNRVADAFSDWPGFGAQTSMADDGAGEAKRCAAK